MTDHPHPGAYISVNTFTVLPGGIDALTAFQLAETQDMGAEATAHGWLGNEIYRAHDGTRLIVLTRFRSAEAREAWAQTDRFRRHIEALRPLIQDVTSVPVALLAARHPDSRT